MDDKQNERKQHLQNNVTSSYFDFFLCCKHRCDAHNYIPNVWLQSKAQYFAQLRQVRQATRTHTNRLAFRASQKAVHKVIGYNQLIKKESKSVRWYNAYSTFVWSLCLPHTTHTYAHTHTCACRHCEETHEWQRWHASVPYFGSVSPHLFATHNIDSPIFNRTVSDKEVFAKCSERRGITRSLLRETEARGEKGGQRGARAEKERRSGVPVDIT